MTHLLIATKQLLETLTQWSRQSATEGEVSDVYVRLGYEFNIACRAFTAIGVDTTDLGPVPDVLRSILEDTLSQEASPASLDKFLPRIRDIIINLLHGLKKKQQRLRSRQQARESASSRHSSSGSNTSSVDTGMTLLDDGPSQRSSGRRSTRRTGPAEIQQYEDQQGIPPRTSSYPSGRASPARQDSLALTDTAGQMSHQDHRNSPPESLSESSMSSNTMQNLPVLSPSVEAVTMPSQSFAAPRNAAHLPAPPPPPKEQDALGALQRTGDLERRASRRYSAYQLSRHLGGSQGGVSILPQAQNSPAPNRGREVRESMNAVRTRGALLHGRQRSANRLPDGSPVRNTTLSRRISEEGGQAAAAPSIPPPEGALPEDSSLFKTTEDKVRRSYTELDVNDQPILGATLAGPPANGEGGLLAAALEETDERAARNTHGQSGSMAEGERYAVPFSTTAPSRLFLPEQSPPPAKELTLFLQYKSRIKKFVLLDGYDELSIARLQLAFIEKFSWNTHSNGEDLPEIYIQDPVSGVRHEIEDLVDIKDRSVLVLNVETLDEVKRHIDESMGGLRRLVEGVRTVVDGQQSALQLVSDRQKDTAKELARLAASPAPGPVRRPTHERTQANGFRSSSSSADNSNQVSEIRRLRRDLALVRQTYSSFASDMATSMSSIRTKAATVKSVAVNVAVPAIDASSGRGYVNAGKDSLTEDSEKIINRVEDLQDVVEDLRKDVVTRGVRPLPRQLEIVSKDISVATAGLKKMQEYLKREKPIWNKVWSRELQSVCNDREFLSWYEEMAADLEDDLEKATQTFALVEQATKQQHLQTGPAGSGVRSTSRGFTTAGLDHEMDPVKAQEGVLGEVRALQPNHETRLEAIERSEKARQRELESRRGGEFQKELGNFVEEGKLKKSGGVEETERMRKAKDEQNRQEVWERQHARAAGKNKQTENSNPGLDGTSDLTTTTADGKASLQPAATEDGEGHGEGGEGKSSEHG